MIDYIHVLDAVNRVNGNRDGMEDSRTVRNLVQILEDYKSRGKFDGTMPSAYLCLQEEGVIDPKDSPYKESSN